jgi:hypothetical protein
MAVRMLGSVRFEPTGLIHILQNDPDALGHVLKRAHHQLYGSPRHYWMPLLAG